MTRHCVIFIQGGGEGANEADALLADSLKRSLEPGYDLRYPSMPNEADPDVALWKSKISETLSRAQGSVTLVGHSIGGSILLRYLAEETPARSIAGLFLLAAPTWDGAQWNFEDLKLPDDIAGRLAGIPRIVLYHCRDDEVVPFAHLALLGERLPRALLRSIDRGGHQFGNDLTGLAEDIRAGES